MFNFWRKPQPEPMPQPPARSPEEYEGQESLPDKEAEAWFNQGYQQYMSGDLVGAIASYDQALQIKPDVHQAWYNRGVMLSGLGRKEEAIASFDHALQIKPDDHYAWFNRGVSLNALGCHEEAIASYDQALAVKTGDHQAWFNRGNSLNALGCHEEAIASYDQALAVKTGDHQAWFNRGNLLNALGCHEEAIASYNHALAIEPDFHQAWFNRGVSLNALECHEEAIGSYDQAIVIKPDKHEAWLNRGNSLNALGRREEAIASYNQALAIKLDKHEAWYNRGNSLSALGRREEAIASYDQAIVIKLDKHEAWVNRGITAAGSLGYSSVRILIGHQFIPSTTITNTALNQRGWEGCIASYTEGLKHCPKDSHPLGHGYIHREFGNAHYDRAKFQTNKTAHYHQAIYHYETALETLTATAFPEDCLQTLQGLIRPLLALDNIAAAKQRRLEGLKVLEQLFNANTSSASKRRLASEFIRFSQIAIDVLVADCEIIAALEAAERNKNQSLTWILDEWKERVLSPSYEQMRSLLNPTTAIVYWHCSEDILTTFVLTPDGDEAIVHTQSTQAFTDWQQRWDKQYQDYRKKGKEQSAHKQNHPWRTSLAQNLQDLSQILNITSLCEDLPHTLTHLILIPHRALHRFPLQALFPNKFATTFLPSLQIGLTLQAKTSLPITPNTRLLTLENPNEDLLYSEAEVALVCSLFHAPTRFANTAATLSNLTDNLPTHQILHFTGHATFAPPTEIPHPTNDLNFTPKATYRAAPESSALRLSDQSLTAKEIQSLDLTAYALISLSSCETSITGLQTLTTEYIGLSSAFLQAGAAHVLGSLWEVQDAAHIWLMIRFYQALLDGNSPAQALHISQQTFQSLTVDQFVPWLQELVEELRSLDCGDWETLESEAIALQNDPDTINFADPYYWAAFTLTGRGTP